MLGRLRLQLRPQLLCRFRLWFLFIRWDIGVLYLVRLLQQFGECLRPALALTHGVFVSKVSGNVVTGAVRLVVELECPHEPVVGDRQILVQPPDRRLLPHLQLVGDPRPYDLTLLVPALGLAFYMPHLIHVHIHELLGVIRIECHGIHPDGFAACSLEQGLMDEFGCGALLVLERIVLKHHVRVNPGDGASTGREVDEPPVAGYELGFQTPLLSVPKGHEESVSLGWGEFKVCFSRVHYGHEKTIDTALLELVVAAHREQRRLDEPVDIAPLGEQVADRRLLLFQLIGEYLERCFRSLLYRLSSFCRHGIAPYEPS